MFLRKKKNQSGSVSIQLLRKVGRKNELVKTIGSAKSEQDIERLWYLGKQELSRLKNQSTLFLSEKDLAIESVFESMTNASIRTVGPELIFGKVYDHIGFDAIEEELFRHLVIARLAFPLSKLKTIEYLYRYQGINLNIDKVYRFLDKLNDKLKGQVELIAYRHTKKTLNNDISVVFYDMTTLYFEASDEDDLRKTGFSKEGKHQNPQIYIGLLVGLGGYAIGYDIYEGNIYEGHTLIPFLEKISNKFDLGKPIVVADSGLLSAKNIVALAKSGYKYILGARLKNESNFIKNQILAVNLVDGESIKLKRNENEALIVAYSNKRAAKDEHNRRRGLQRLEKQIKAGKFTKGNINNRGYNKYLKLTGEVTIDIDYEKFEKDKRWDGLKGYQTNTRLSKDEIVTNYQNLWHIEKAFRMSKTDLRIRPIYHRLRNRIEAHICISFTAYCIYKEIERILYKEKSRISIKKAAELTHNMYQATYMLPESKHIRSQLLKMDTTQADLYNIIQKNTG